MRSRMRSTGEAAYLISLYLLFHLPPTFVRRQRFDSFIILPIEEKEEYDRRNKQEESSPSDNMDIKKSFQTPFVEINIPIAPPTRFILNSIHPCTPLYILCAFCQYSSQQYPCGTFYIFFAPHANRNILHWAFYPSLPVASLRASGPKDWPQRFEYFE